MSILNIGEDKQLKISYGILIGFIGTIISIGMWVGNVDKSVAHVEKRLEKIETDAYEELKEMNTRLSRIEGALGIQKK